jgi:hypothetical protein
MASYYNNKMASHNNNSNLDNTCNLMCLSCNGNLAANDPASQYIRLKLIQNTVRVPSSLYTMNLGALNVYQYPVTFDNVNWNQMSDRYQRHSQPVNVSSHGSRTRRTITRNRPNASTPGGLGVDIKHNSYYRYLDRLKGKGPIRRGTIPSNFGKPVPFNPAFPVYGGKTMKTSIVNNCNCPIVPAGLNENLIYQTYYAPSDIFKPGCNTCNYDVGSYIYSNFLVDGLVVRALIQSIDGDFYTILYDDGTVHTLTYANILADFKCSCPGNTNVENHFFQDSLLSCSSSVERAQCALQQAINSNNSFFGNVKEYYLSCVKNGSCNTKLI